MIGLLPALLLAAPSLAADFPGATIDRAPDGGPVLQASGFRAEGLGATPGEAARRFVERYAADLGVGPGQKLRVAEALPGTRALLSRAIGGFPVFQGDIVVGFDAGNAVVLVSAQPVPRQAGKFRLGRAAAVKRALAAVEGGARPSGPVTATRGWYPAGEVTRPAWRVDAATVSPAGSWRVVVDAEDGTVLFRRDRRVSGRVR